MKKKVFKQSDHDDDNNIKSPFDIELSSAGIQKCGKVIECYAKEVIDE